MPNPTQTQTSQLSVIAVPVFGLLAACSGPLIPPEPEAEAGREVVIHGAPTESGTSHVVRLEVRDTTLDPAGLVLFEGSLSEYYERRLRERSIPESLADRVVPTLSWQEPEALWLGNTEELVAGQRYTLGQLGVGVVHEFDVSLTPPPLALRLWPPPGVLSAFAAYCGVSSARETDGTLKPGDLSFYTRQGIAESPLATPHCVSMRVSAMPGQRVLSPLKLGDEWVAVSELGLPTPVAPSVESTSLTCEEHEQAFGPGCSEAFDHFVRVRTPLEPQLWLVEQPGTGVQILQPRGSFILRELSPGTANPVFVSVLNTDGELAHYDVTLQMKAARATLVLNEVMANPNGPEPAQEWVELVNVGSLAAELEGLVLEDGAGEAILPAARLEPGAHVLIVNPTYDPSYPFDVPPSAGTQLLVVEALGKSGLSNSGEPLILRDAQGSLLSAIPPLKHSVAGYSVARRAPELGDVVASFGLHADPGASPGGVNEVPEE